MTVNIALFLSADGLALAHRQTAGHWAMIGETPLAIDDLDGALAALRDEAVAREGENFKTLLVLPDDQMLYTSLTVPTADPELTAFRIEEGLDGMTPYAVTELEYDWRVLEEDRVSIAVVARETLDEAKGFAAQYGFKGAGFAAMPPMQRFPGVPTFAVDADADDFGFSADGIAFGPDRHGQPDPEPEPEPEPEVAPDPAPEIAAPAAPDTPPAEAAPDPAPDPASAIADTQSPAPTDPMDAPDAPSDGPVQDVPVIDDITTPIQPLTDAEIDPSLDDSLPAAPSPAAQEARQRARIIRGEASTPVPATGTEPQVTAKRGQVAAPDTGTGSLVGQRSARIDLAAAENAAPTAPAPVTDPAPAPEVGTAPQGKAGMPRLAEQLQRVRSASKTKPKSDAAGAPQTRPRVEIEPRPPEETSARGLDDRTSPFEAPPQGAADTTSAPRKGGLGGALRGLGGAAAPTGKAATGAASGGFFRRDRGDAASSEPAQGTDPDAAGTMADDGTFASGLLARKSVPAASGPSFRTGLVLTVILLLLLALVAIWSAVFLPNSAVARLFGFGGTDVQTTAAAPADVQAPDVFTAAPSIGGTAAPTLEDEAAADGMDLAALPEIDDAPLPLDDTPAAAPDAATDADLPDIDAEFDLPPLPPIDQGQNPSVEEAEALYAEDGIWARSPDRPDLRPFDLLDSIYTASIDPRISALDAVALPEPGVNPGELLRRFPPPPPFGTEFSLTNQGLVAATSQGVVTPEGAFVVAGAPPVFARQRPREIADPTPPNTSVDDAVLGTFRPTQRPSNLAELRERQVLGGLTQSELGERRPTSRPQSPQEAAAAASLFPSEDSATDTETATAVPDTDVTAALEAAIGGTELAVARSRLPATRPSNISQIVASADRQPTAAPTTVAAAAVAPGPDIPSNADVSRAATERDAIRLRNVNLIGVTGTNSDRRALVRLSSGRFVRVSVGDRLDGGRVAAIGETTLQYVRSGRTVTLEIPG
ncbi:hypothetical protein [Gymnodinialimonas ulvae]|uniref:hypothetical protein n=1 Tax=Gymnodinialimonas ulvae TaxID=3126504 RepID=UPI0030A5944D